MSLLLKGGISKLSELIIDADKNWAGKGISNIKELAAGMTKGDVVQHSGAILEKLMPSVANYVLTSEGALQLVTWGPGGTYFIRYLPVSIDLSHAEAIYTPDRAHPVSSPLVSPFGNIYGSVEHNPTWFRKQEPAITLSKANVVFTPDHSNAEPAVAGSEYDVEIPVAGAIADDGGVTVDETAAAKSGPAIDQSYTAGEDSQKPMNASTKWEAQTPTQAANSKVRYVRLKLWRTPSTSSLGLVTVSIQGTLAGKPDGVDVCSGTIDGETLLGTPGRYVRIDFGAPVDLTAAVVYAIVVRHGGIGTLNWRCDATAPGYAGGSRVYSTNSGIAWTIDVNADFMFEEYCTVNDMTLFPAAIVANDAYYFGYSAKFPILRMDVGQVGAGTYTAVWEYSTGGGAYAACVGLVDGTTIFKTAWTQEVSHTPQGAWALENIMGHNLYWLRCRCTNAGAGYVQPLGTWARVRITI